MKNLQKNNQQTGQMVILVMLVLVVALTIGLSLVTRQINNSRQSANTELANRAYSAAEAGVEEALRAGGSTSNTPVGVGAGNNQATYKTTVTTQGNSTEPFLFPNPLSQDEAVQVWLFDYKSYQTSQTFPAVTCSGSGANTHYMNECATRDLRVVWGTTPATGDSIPALEMTLLYRDSANAFQIEKCAFDPNSTRNPANGFSKIGGSSDSTICNSSPATFKAPADAVTIAGQNKSFNYQKTITLPNASGGKKYLLMRLKLLYNGDTKQEIAVVPPTTGAPLPAQGSVIESEGNAGEVVRKIKVYQSFPTLPGVFDFVLFNGSTNPLQK